MKKDVIKLPPGKVIPATNDVVFKNLIHKNKDFLAKLISLVTKLDYQYLLDNMYLSDTNSLDNNIYKHHNNQDVIVTINNLTINIEMSIDNKNININKNTITSLKYAGNMYNKGDTYKEEYMFYQICIENYNIFNNKELISEVALTNISSGKYELNDNIFRIYHVNLKNISKVCYTELDEVNKFFKFISTDDIKELETLSKGDEILEKSADTIKQMSINRILISPEEKEKILEYSIRVGHKKDIEEAREEGITKGKNLGQKQEKQEIARNMIKKGISLEDIMEITGLTKEEIERL